LVPFRHAPGLSIGNPSPIPEQLAVYTDGDGMSAIDRWDGSPESLRFLDWLPSALPYHLLPPKPKVLALGAGGGSDVLQAIVHDAGRVDAVELNPQTIELVRDRFAEFAGPVYRHTKVRVHAAEARGFVAASPEGYDLIQLALLDAFNTSSAGLYGLNESYLYTVEALQTYLAHLRPGGLLALTRWVRLPPRDEAKLFATAIAALERSGESHPGRRLLWIRGWQTSTLLVKNGPFGDADIDATRRFCAERSFDTAYFPGIRDTETNLYNVQKQPYLSEAALELLGPDRDGYIDRYKFDIRPATDDRPYFFHFFRWPILAEALNLRGAGGLGLIDLGYPMLIATLIQAVVIGGLLILAPLQLFAPGAARQPKGQVFAYFAAVGIAFMFTEIVYIQKFILYLSHPLYAVAVVLAGFLLFAGLGSRHAETVPKAQAAAAIVGAARSIVAISLVYLLLLPPLFEASMALPGAVKVATVLTLIAPLAYFMGMPFPLGLARLTAGDHALMPWAFGINGCASVTAAILATVLAIHSGQNWLLIAALALYATAALTAAHYAGK
jgi:SAM-dependent methyltransferase